MRTLEDLGTSKTQTFRSTFTSKIQSAICSPLRQGIRELAGTPSPRQRTPEDTIGQSDLHLKEDTDDDHPPRRNILSAGQAIKRQQQKARRNYFPAGKLASNNSPIKIRCFPNEYQTLNNRLKSPHSPLNVVSPSVIPEFVRFNYQDLGYNTGNWKQLIGTDEPMSESPERAHGKGMSTKKSIESLVSNGMRRREESFSPKYNRIFESNKYHIVNSKGKKHKHEMNVELNDALSATSSFRKPVADLKPFFYERSSERPAINKDDILNRRPHDNRFKVIKNSDAVFKKQIKDISLSKGPRRSFKFNEVAMYARGDH